MPGRSLIVFSVCFLLIHLALFIHDLASPGAFLTGDRGKQRMEKISVVMPTLVTGATDQAREPWRGHVAESCLPSSIPDHPFWGSLAVYGQPGDYFLQGLVWLAGGQYAVIALQVLLAFLAAIYVYRIALFFVPERLALACACVYAILPASLMQPHQLVTEAIYNPVLIIATYYVIRYADSGARGALVAAAAMLAVGILLRTQLLLMPLLLLLLLLAFDGRDRVFKVATLLGGSFSLLIGWFGLNYLLTGDLGLDRSDSSLGLNLYINVMRAEGYGWHEIERYTCRGMSLGEFLGYSTQNPGAMLSIKVKDLANLLGNPTTYKFFGEYLGVIDRLSWDYTTVRDQEGFTGVLHRTVQLGPLYILAMGVGGIAWLILLAGAVLGAGRLLVDAAVSAKTKWIIMTVLAYGLVMPMVATPRSTHRSPVEFIFVLLFVYIAYQASVRRRGGGGQATSAAGGEGGV